VRNRRGILEKGVCLAMNNYRETKGSPRSIILDG